MLQRNGVFGWMVVFILAGCLYTTAAQQCECTCSFPKNNQVTRNGKEKIDGGTRYTFAPNANISCTGDHCSIQSTTYAWTIGGTATATINGPANAPSLIVDVTAEGSLTVTCTITVTCTGGQQCTCTGTHTWNKVK